jgi:MFS family permease
MILNALKASLGSMREKSGSESSSALVGTFLVANAFVWYLGAFKFLQEGFANNALLLIISINIIALVLTAFVVTLLMKKFTRRLVFLKYWIIVGLIISVSYAALSLTDFVSVVTESAVLGAYFGLGMPICMGYFSASTKPEKRAKSAAIIILVIGLGFPALTLFDVSQTFLIAAALTAWRFLALFFIYLFNPNERLAEPKETASYRSIVVNKTFLLYIVPWVMFVLINDLTTQMNNIHFASFPPVFANNYLIIENVFSGVSAVACGLIADRKGRKSVALPAFALLGLGYAALGIFGGSYAYSAAWFYICADGVAWGAFSMLFLITVWGDMAQEGNSEKYYFIGVLPYLISNIMGITLGGLITTDMSVGTAFPVFSFASFFLFMSILPLAYAPETLSERILSKLDIDDYVSKALEKSRKDTSSRLEK